MLREKRKESQELEERMVVEAIVQNHFVLRNKRKCSSHNAQEEKNKKK